MKRVMFALLFVAATAAAQTTPAPNTLTMNGEATVKLPPDRASVTVGIWVVDPDVGKAFREAIARSHSVGDALRAKGIRAEDLQTADFSVSTVTEREDKPDAPPRFGVKTTITASRDSATDPTDLLTAAIDAGANRVEGVTFESTHPAPARDLAFAAAFNDARARAEKVAAVAGRKLGAVISIANIDSGFVQAITKSGVSIFAGTSEVSANLSVVFELK
ncbi:MAG: uncharacterized protein QOI24_183 [Acidobacteriota bacterium]|nr:uncharacterized protein [Acidobacteriota bacterium]